MLSLPLSDNTFSERQVYAKSATLALAARRLGVCTWRGVGRRAAAAADDRVRFVCSSREAAADLGGGCRGEAGPVHSIGLKIAGNVPWPIADLRVDWHDTDPVGELAKLWAIYAPQLDDYVIRALDPTKAPSFGVPGDK